MAEQSRPFSELASVFVAVQSKTNMPNMLLDNIRIGNHHVTGKEHRTMSNQNHEYAEDI